MNIVTDKTPEYRELRQAVRSVCQQFPETYWRDLDEVRGYPKKFIQALTAGGFLAAMIPEEYGGMGLTVREGGLILEEINHCGGNAAPGHAQMYIMGSLLRHGSAEQKRHYLPQIASGKLRLQAFGVTEPDAGSDTTSISTSAVREGKKYVINGRKVWISRVMQSDLMLLLTRTTPKEECVKRSDGLSMFLVDLREAIGHGLEVNPLQTMINHHTNELVFEDLAIPEENMVGEEGKGFGYILSSMNAERILIASESLGDGWYFIEKAVDYANSRKVFNRPIGQNQGVAHPIAKAYMHLRAAMMMRDEAAELFNQGQNPGNEANSAKYLAAEAAWMAANTCMDVHGGYSMSTEYHIERKFREARLYMVAPVSQNMVLNFVCHNILGLPRSF